MWQEQGRATIDSPRCSECPLTLLEAYMTSPAGQLIRLTFDLEFALQAGVTVRLGEIPYPEFLLLRILSEERIRLHEEWIKDPKRHGG